MRSKVATPRLVHLADYGGLYSGSFIPMLIAIAKTARASGWSVEFVFSELAREREWLADVDEEGIPYRFMEVRRSRSRRWLSWLAAEATRGSYQDETTRAIALLLEEAREPTILHTHFSTFDVAAAQACRKAANAMVLWHEHSMRRRGWTPTIGAMLTHRVLGRNVSEYLFVAPDAGGIARLGYRTRSRFVPNAIDGELFVPATPEARVRARVKLGIAPEARVLLHFGSHWLRKGGDLYLSAVKSLLKRPASRDLLAITVGGEEARTAVETAGLPSNVIVFEPREDVRDLYAASDVLVSPSRSEGMPLAILEAVAMGLPVVASNIPGQAYVGTAVSACRLTRLDPDYIAASIVEVLDLDPEEQARERALAREWIIEYMSLESWTQTLMKIYGRLLRKP